MQVVITEPDCQISIERDSSRLIVAIGDSFTWGAELDEGRVPSTPNRVQNLFGVLIAEHYDANLINFGMNGGSNVSIIKKLEELIQTHKHYDKVNYIITLTEVGREFYNGIELKDIEHGLQQQEQAEYDEINRIINEYNVDVTVGRAFTKDYESTVTHLPHIKTWYELLYNESANNGQYKLEDIIEAGPMSSTAYDVIKAKVDSRSAYQNFVLNQQDWDRIDRTFKWCKICDLTYSGHHPTAKGHKIWAEYLLQGRI